MFSTVPYIVLDSERLFRRKFETPRDPFLSVLIVFFFRLSFSGVFFGAMTSTSHSSFREGFVSGTQPAGLLCIASQTDYCKVVSPRLITTSSLVSIEELRR